MNSDIIDFEVGLQVAVRTGYTSWYGTFTAVTPTQATVTLADGRVLKFSRNSRFQIGSEESRYTRPYITTVATARAKDANYARLTRDAASRRAAS